MFEAAAERDNLIDTRVNFWPSLVDGITSVLVVMFLLYVMKAMAAGDMEAIQAQKAMQLLQSMIEQRFRNAGLAGVVHCRYKTNILQVTFSDAVLFDSNDYHLPLRGRRVLAVCAQALTAPGVPVYQQMQVEGHTDSVPLHNVQYPHDNWELSSARALEVLKQLMAFGVRPEVISANGYADQQKIDRGHGPEADKKNRRIELRVIYSIPKLVERRTR